MAASCVFVRAALGGGLGFVVRQCAATSISSRTRFPVKSSSGARIRLDLRMFCSNAAVEASLAESAARAAESELQEVDALDIRVGRIVKAWKHPDADSLYVEEVDLAEESGPRTICSGLVKYVPEDELQGKLVAVLANLKPRNMKGIKSNGMLLAASDKAHEIVELIVPPDGSQPGERIWFGSEDERSSQVPAATPNQLQKKKIWEALQPKLSTGEDLVVRFDGRPMRTSAGFIKSKTLAGANVS